MRAKTKLLEDEQKIASLKSSIAKAKEDVKTRVDTYSENRYSMTVGKKTYTDKKEAGAALALEIIAKAKTGEFVTVGKFAGFEIRVIKQGSEYVGHITGAQSYKFNVYLEKTTYMATHIASVVEGIDGRIEAWNGALKETQADLAAQQKMIAEPFAKQAELDRKAARFNEIMDILNPKEEQIIGDEEDAVQYQAREKGYFEDIRDDILYPKKKDDAEAFLRSYANKTSNLKNGSAKNIVVFTSDDAYFVTATGYLKGNITKVMPLLGNEETVKKFLKEFKDGTYRRSETFNTWAEIIRRRNGRNARDNVSSKNAGTAERTNAVDVGSPESDTFGNSGENYGYDSLEDLIKAVKSGAMIMDKDGNLVKFDDIQYQERSSPLTDREVLEMAAEGIEVDSLSEAEKNALDIFSKRLSELAQLQEERAELGRQYKPFVNPFVKMTLIRVQQCC